MPEKPFQNSSFSASTRVSCETVLDRVPKTYENLSFSTRTFEVCFFLILFYCVFDPGLPFFLILFSFFDPAALASLKDKVEQIKQA